ncbi:hypothetical protein GLOIN_2v1772508 [Rhizophagus clarus]|nr:hypothetical protein GLOIN_2v1772508 [Rhizophagus clarus]
MKYPKNYHFIEIYLHNLNDDDKSKLSDYGINNDLFSSNTLFNYPEFIQQLNTNKVHNSIKNWIKAIRRPSSNFIYKSSLHLISRLLFLIFIENEVSLHSFEVIIDAEEKYYVDSSIVLILQKPNFIRNIKNLTLNLNRISHNISKFLIFFHSNCNSISSLYFQFLHKHGHDDHLKTEKLLSQIINSQENLRKITFYHHNLYSLYHSLLSLKNPNCLNTLKTIIFYRVYLNDVVVLSEVLNQLNNLESVHIIYCNFLDTKFINNIINTTKPFKLKSLFWNNEILESIELLMQKSGNYLENFGNGHCYNFQLLKLLKSYCGNIKFLHLHNGLNVQNIVSTFDLIEINKQSLNYLYIDATCNGIEESELSSIVLQKLGQILPFKMEYLDLSLKIDINDLELFLRNSQNTYIKKLLIKYSKTEENEDILPYIKEYIMKKKRVKYLNILEKPYGELFLLKDEVKEFKLHGIQVLKYYDLHIDIDVFIKEII